MKRLVLPTSVALVAVSVATVAAAASGPPTRAQLNDFMCVRSLQEIDRQVSVQAVMRPVAGTRRLEVRFELQIMTAGQRRYSAVTGGDLGTWLSPSSPPTLGQNPNDVWTISHPVANLRAPAVYRFRVSFRWIGPASRVISQQSLTSEKCSEPDLRPDLLVQKITVSPVSGTEDEYSALIRNAGDSAAVGPFEVTLTTSRGADAAAPVTIQRLGSHRSRDVTFLGATCTPSTAPFVTVDPNHVVDDLNPDNNSLQARCPPTRSTPVAPTPPLHLMKQ